ncbi:hypothetical protein, partial [Escherichia coli]|uniref:hypothetical protein n=1 Tax=Escherichia coli TaxID=562 RepID=UPI0011BAB153
LTVDVAAQSSAGNPLSLSHPFTADLTALAIRLTTVPRHDLINAAQQGPHPTLSGRTRGLDRVPPVTVPFFGNTYPASVAAIGSCIVHVPPSDLATLPDGAANVQASFSSATAHSASAPHASSVAPSAPPPPLHPLSSDSISNAPAAAPP